MIVPPDTEYAVRGDGHLAYQVAGSGGVDLVYVAGSWSCSFAWDEPVFFRGFARLARFARVVTFDPRGVGRSDPIDPNDLPTLEDRVADLAAVTAAARTSTPVVFGTHDGGPVALLYAASHPVSHLVLCNTWARLRWAEDYNFGFPDEVLDRTERRYREGWGTGTVASMFTPGTSDGDVRPGVQWGRRERAVATPGQAVALFRNVRDLDVRGVLDAIRVPTLVIHLRDNRTVPPEHGRYLAEHLPGARYVELPGADQAFLQNHAQPVFDEVEEFVTGTRGRHDRDGFVAALLFTDIVDSTRKAVEIGDARWAELLDDHNERVRREIARYGGREIKTLGDGFLAAFDGPAHAIRCACSVVSAVAPLGLSLRAGLHVGEIQMHDQGDVAGLTVHIARRVSELARPGQVLVTSVAKDLAPGSGAVFTSRGEHALRGVPGTWELFEAAV